MTTKLLSQHIERGEGKKALDQAIAEGMSPTEIHDLYRAINFYPNDETCKYISDRCAARKNKEALDGFFSKVNV